jgi:RNA polymerase sigma-70 factor, ECF subfamily
MGALQTSPLTFPSPLQGTVYSDVLPRKRNRRETHGNTTPFGFKKDHRLTKFRKPVSTAADESAIGQAHQGDWEELNAIFARHRSRLYRAACAVLRNKEEAEDAVQEGLLSAYLHLSSFQGRSLFSTWLTRITINAALMKRRKQMTIPEVSFDAEGGDASEFAYVTAMPSTDPDPEQLCAASEIRELVRNRMNQLSDGHRSAIQLRYIEGLSTSEAARSSDISVCKLKSRLFHARRQLALRWGQSKGQGMRPIRAMSTSSSVRRGEIRGASNRK